MKSKSQRINFDGGDGAKLSAKLDTPPGEIRAFALFAHCFTCSKEVHATRRIAAELARLGIAVLRFDFTGLGSSDGDFASTNFSSNVEDLVRAAELLRENFAAPSILIGHSLGGAAVLAAAGRIPEVRAVATIGAPAEAEHVIHNFSADIGAIERDGEAEVMLGGRKFNIQKQFIDDLRSTRLTDTIALMKKALLVMHSPIDTTVGIENAQAIFLAAKHPKSFVSLDGADHLMTKDQDALFAGQVIAAWVARYLDGDQTQTETGDLAGVLISETNAGKFQNTVQSGPHRFFADEPKSVGGLNSGPSPYDLVAAGIGACTSMTLRMYADLKKLDIGRISVQVSHNKVHATDCAVCTDEERDSNAKIDIFNRIVTTSEPVDDATRERLLKIADKCPVHRTLEHGAKVETEFRD